MIANTSNLWLFFCDFFDGFFGLTLLGAGGFIAMVKVVGKANYIVATQQKQPLFKNNSNQKISILIKNPTNF